MSGPSVGAHTGMLLWILLSESLLTGGSAGRAVNATCWCLDASLLKATVLPGGSRMGNIKMKHLARDFTKARDLDVLCMDARIRAKLSLLPAFCTDASTGRGNCHTDRYGFSAVLVAAQRPSWVLNRRCFVPVVISRRRYLGI